MIFFLYIEYIIFILRTKKKKARKKERDKQMIELWKGMRRKGKRNSQGKFVFNFSGIVLFYSVCLHILHQKTCPAFQMIFILSMRFYKPRGRGKAVLGTDACVASWLHMRTLYPRLRRNHRFSSLSLFLSLSLSLSLSLFLSLSLCLFSFEGLVEHLRCNKRHHLPTNYFFIAFCIFF